MSKIYCTQEKCENSTTDSDIEGKVEEWKCWEHDMDYEDVVEHIKNIENDDDNVSMLESAMQYYCGTHDKCEGYKHALLNTLHDQYTHHYGEQEPDDLIKLMEYLKK